MADRLEVAEMNVAICRALGIDPEGVRSLTVILDTDQVPRIEVTYSAGYIAKLAEKMDDGTKIAQRWAYELVPLADMELAAPANGSDWVPPSSSYPHPTDLPPTPYPPESQAQG